MHVVTLTYPWQLSEQTLVGYDDALEPNEASVSAVPGAGFTVTVWVDQDDPLKAAAQALRTACQVVSGDPVAIAIVTEAEYHRVAAEPTLPALMSAPEVGELLGVSRQRVHQLSTQAAAFPAPLYRLRTGPIWAASAIEHFARTWPRTAGRPAKT